MAIRMTVLATAALAATAGTAQAQLDKLLIVDLTVANEITITATNGASAETVSGGDGTGVLMDNFYGGPSASGFLSLSGVGDLAAVGDTPDGTPGLFNSAGNAGLNFWAWTPDFPSQFTAGSQAFSGSATWALDAVDYDQLVAGNTSGLLYAFADTDDDIAGGAVVIGTWNVVPAPSTAAALGLAGLAATRRRR